MYYILYIISIVFCTFKFQSFNINFFLNIFRYFNIYCLLSSNKKSIKNCINVVILIIYLIIYLIIVINLYNFRNEVYTWT